MTVWLLLKGLISGGYLPTAVGSSVIKCWWNLSASESSNRWQLYSYFCLYCLFCSEHKAIPTIFCTYLGLSQTGMTVATATLECTWLWAIFSSSRSPVWEGGAVESTERFPCSLFWCLPARSSTYNKSRVTGLERSWCRKNIWDYSYWDSSKGWFLFAFLTIVLPLSFSRRVNIWCFWK